MRPGEIWSRKIGSRNELEEIFRPLGRPLPRDDYGRRDKHVLERWILAKWIESGDLSSYWTDYPFSLTQPDRPDFIFSSDKASLGIEIAQITGRVTEQARVLAHKEDLDFYHVLGSEYQNRPMRRDELYDRMRKGDGGALLGDEPTRAFVRLASRLIDKKIARSANYQKVDGLLLLLYDNSSLYVDWRNLRDKAILEELHERGRNAGPFRAVCVYSDEQWHPETA